ncbi:MAG: hypothetical protein K9N07_11330 [Candidatus Cloacimonetes bacterium]|nr:hypothetical protein [Candidatus Cloacimonadota bacterium]
MDLISYSNLLTYLGFNLAIFAFLSQYLSFPKDILSELSRIERQKDKHEYPCKESDRVTIKKDGKKAGNILKAFFLEIDTITFIILFYLVYSSFVLTSMIAYKYFNNNSFLEMIFYSGIFYIAFTEFPIIFEMVSNSRKWPAKQRAAKYIYLCLFIVIDLIIGVYIIKNHKEFEKIFLFLIFGLLSHFCIYAIPLFIRKPITNLLYLWENLND